MPRFHILVAALALALMGSASPLWADLVDLGGSTLDTETSLEWLDLTETVQIRPMDILLREDPDQLLDQGWRYATFEEIATLFGHASLAPPFDGSGASSYEAGMALLELIGITDTDNTNGPVSLALGYAPESPPRVKGLWYLTIVFAGTPAGGESSAGALAPGPFMGLGIDLFASATTGNWLVREAAPTGARHRSWGEIKKRYR